MTSSPPPPFAALLLAGGRSARMGRDKALLDWHGQALFQAQFAKLLALRPAKAFIACRQEQHLESCFLLGGEVAWLYDPPGEDVGPMGPITRALEAAALPLLVLATDMPLVSAEFLRDHLLAQWQTERGIFLESSHGIQPLLGVYTPPFLPLLTVALSAGAYSVQSVVREAVRLGLATVVPLPAEAEDYVKGANTPGEWAAQQSHAP